MAESIRRSSGPEDIAATEQRMIEFTADISLRTTAEDADVYQAVQDAIGHTGAKVIEITFIEGAVDADHA